MPEPKPVWAPLEKIALLSRHHPDLPSFHEWEFVYMHARPESAPYRVHADKHRDTRVHLHLDDEGRPIGQLGFDAPADAMAGLRLDEFDATPALHRSMPPDQWLPDDAEAVRALELHR